MIILWLALLIKVANTQYGITPHLQHIDEIPNVAKHKDAEHRGPRWYDYNSQSESASDLERSSDTETESTSSSESFSPSDSSSASSFETKERRKATRVYRVCTPCPEDMMKSHKNKGIKWICGGYQRARRSFKSDCMMRYRNCEDGTMFVKFYDGRCKPDKYHGRSWFYIYRV